MKKEFKKLKIRENAKITQKRDRIVKLSQRNVSRKRLPELRNLLARLVRERAAVCQKSGHCQPGVACHRKDASVRAVLQHR